MRLLLLISIFFIFLIKINAQQDPQFTMNWTNLSMFNPAETGLSGKHYFNNLTRTQWVDWDGAPITHTGFYEVNIDKINSGIGGYYLIDKIGHYSFNRFGVKYSYQLELNDNRILSHGISIGCNIIKVTDSWIPPDISGNDDDIINLNDLKFNSIPFKLGLSYKSNKLKTGISLHKSIHLEDIGYRTKDFTYIFCSYKLNQDGNITYQPQVYIKTDLKVAQIDFSLLSYYKERIWIGTSYRHDDAICFMGGIDILGKYRIGYSYDLTTSEIRHHSNNTHEVVLGLIIK